MIWNSDYYDRRKWFPSMNTVVRYNLLEEIPGDGIVPIGCDGVLIEYNLMRRSTPLLTPPESAAGLWAWSCDNIVIQYNEVSDMKAPWDGQGFDADWNSLNTTIRYNYSHDNEGGFLLLCDAGDQREYSLGNRDIRVNYNLSIGDGTRTAEVRGKKLSPLICMFGNTSNTIIDHNVFHINSRLITEGDPSFVGAGNWYGEADSTAYIKMYFTRLSLPASRWVLPHATTLRITGIWGKPSLLHSMPLPVESPKATMRCCTKTLLDSFPCFA